MRRDQQIRRRLLWYLLPIMVGMSGVLFSSQLQDNPLVRFLVVLVSVAIPLFVLGSLLSREGGQGLERLVLMGGMLLLLVGAAASYWNAPRAADELVPTNVVILTRWIGMFSLVLGLSVVLVWAVRTREAADELSQRFRHVADHISDGFVLSSRPG